MSETTENLIETLPEKLDAPPKTVDAPAVVELQDMRKKSKSGHRKYLWISFVSNAITALLSGVMTYMSYVMSDIGEVARFATLTVIYLGAHKMIFTLLRPKKGSRVQLHHAMMWLVSSYLIFSHSLAKLCVNDLIIIFFEGERLGSTQDICKRDDAVGKQRCTVWSITEYLMLVAPIFMIIASSVLKGTAIERRGSEMIPMDPIPKIAAWGNVSLEELNEDNEPGQVWLRIH